MPCVYYTREEDRAILVNEVKVLRAELDKVTNLLCSLCSTLLEKFPDSQGLVDIRDNKELKSWWKTHQKLDKARMACLAQKKKAALAKLSDEEKKLLGLT